MSLADRAERALARVAGALPAGEARPGQVAMARAVAAAIEDGQHLLVQAGTGTGKSLGYLVPAVLSGKRTVVATATKALQEQLVGRDIPHLAEHLGHPFTAALLKGRSNYLCRSALADAVSGQEELLGGTIDRQTLAEVVEWTAVTPTGDRSDLPFALSAGDWGRLSVGVGECPGAQRCPYGDVCFAEDARHAAAEADVVVVNTHLYGIHLATGRAILPEHEIVVIDEAHALEDIAAGALGATVGPGRIEHLARAGRGIFTVDHPVPAALDAAAARLATVLDGLGGQRVDPTDADLGAVLLACAEAATGAASAARALDVSGDAGVRRDRLSQEASHLAGDLRALAEPAEGTVVWVEAGRTPALRAAPVDVGGELAEQLFAHHTVVLTSATLTVGGQLEPVADRLGAGRPAEPGGEAQPWTGLDVGSPFDFERQALLYCAAHLPDPRRPGYEAAMLEELTDLVEAAGGRTLALFTSRRAMDAAADHLAGKIDMPILVQDTLPRPALHDAFVADESSVLLATMGFWQGFDAPGRTCSLVVIDRLPFPRPDDPLSVARREEATRRRTNAFAAVDLPRAAMLLAQGAGRLVRTATDRGVVAVLDPRLATASYRWTLVRSLPPMRRTKDPAAVRAELAELAGTAVG